MESEDIMKVVQIGNVQESSPMPDRKYGISVGIKLWILEIGDVLLEIQPVLALLYG